ncbi:MAG: hypothetical protein HC843_09745 [Sphingomonadales bacterium]|nr:hypothetical protein [Sphingomonadales bacterium]
MKNTLCLIALITTTSCVTTTETLKSTAAAKLVWSADFQDDDGKLAAIKSEIDDAPDHRARDQVRLLKNCIETGNSCVEVELRKPIYDEKGDIVVKYNVNGEVDLGGYRGRTATLNYRVFIPSGFVFRRQGKMPGLSPLNGAFGGDAPYAAIPDKWSARLMWLDIEMEKGRPLPSLYLYDQRRAKGRTGEHNKGRQILSTGRWHSVAIFVHLNRTGQSDGRAELWINEQLMACRTNMMFRNTESDATMIQRLSFHNYFGGSAKNADQFPDKSTTMRFDDFAVFDGRATPATPDDGQCKSEYAPNYLIPK